LVALTSKVIRNSLISEVLKNCSVALLKPLFVQCICINEAYLALRTSPLEQYSAHEEEFRSSKIDTTNTIQCRVPLASAPIELPAENTSPQIHMDLST